MFRFKQFSVEDDRSTMKVGTDAVLLGASAGHGLCLGLGPDPRILDIGTGCGLIALMMAQRFPEAHIDAIDIDAPSVAQARENFDRSPWAERLHAEHSPLQQWQASPYHLIVSNPPFFTASLKNPDPRRAQARHNDSLPLPDLLRHSARLLAPHGRLALILPPNEAASILNHSLFPIPYSLSTSLQIRPTERHPVKRVILTLEKDEDSHRVDKPLTQSILTLRNPDGSLTEEHRRLTQAFYL